MKLSGQIDAANENTANLMVGEFDFSPRKILNRTLIFDTTIINEEIIIGRIIDAIGDKYNDKYYIEHNPQQIILPWEQTMEDKKILKETKNIFNSLKTDPNSVLFSEEIIDKRLLKKLKKIELC